MKFTNAAVLALSTAAGLTEAAKSKHPAHAIQQRAARLTQKAQEKREAMLSRRAPAPSSEPHYHKKRDSQFLNNATQQFAVDGKGLPDVPFDIGESYAGLLPISSAANETRKLFFWFFPTTNANPTDEVTVWFNGGPGCSSLSGLLTENGPFLWQAGTLAPTQNPYSWVNLTNMLWVEQPVGVGYDQGVPNITNEVELGSEFLGFYKNLVDIFNINGWDLYLTGESYAGTYVPHIADTFIQANSSDFTLKGIAINDPVLADENTQLEIPVVQYADYWSNLFYLNDTFNAAIHAKADECGYTAYLEKYLTFPPPQEPFPLIANPFVAPNYTCDIFDDVYFAALEVNPCFNIYHITDQCPHPWDVLGIVNPGDYSPPGEQVYFNRTDVQQALHAVVGTNWMQCTNINVFGGEKNDPSLSDTSPAPGQDGVLQRVIETTNNVIIGSGNLDFLLSTNGTLLAIQNTTWNGAQGFTEYPNLDFYVPYHPEYNGGSLAGAGNLGKYVAERGLTFYFAQLSGHELPGYVQGAGYRVLELLLGKIQNLGEVSDFTTQTGNFTGTSPIFKREHAKAIKTKPKKGRTVRRSL